MAAGADFSELAQEVLVLVGRPGEVEPLAPSVHGIEREDLRERHAVDHIIQRDVVHADGRADGRQEPTESAVFF